MGSTDPREDELGDPLLDVALPRRAKLVLIALFLLFFAVAIDLCVFLLLDDVPNDQTSTALWVSSTLAIGGGLTATALIRRHQSGLPNTKNPGTYAVFGGVGFAAYVFLRPFPLIRVALFCFVAAWCSVTCLWAITQVIRGIRSAPEASSGT